MTTDRTTAEALNTRAASYVNRLPSDDPLAEANALISQACVLQNLGKFAEADKCLDRADRLMARV